MTAARTSPPTTAAARRRPTTRLRDSRDILTLGWRARRFGPAGDTRRRRSSCIAVRVSPTMAARMTDGHRHHPHRAYGYDAPRVVSRGSHTTREETYP